ncbi:hypothetical protein FRC20_003547 [Serendipita sp. 405]|nr:hypothetical protein FRC20_003547 [Serendipita sp. 405]
MDGPRSNAAESGMAYIGSIPTVAMEDESVQQQDMNNLIINRSPMKLSRSATTNAALDQVTRSRMERMVPLDKHAAARSATDSYADTRRLSPTSDQVVSIYDSYRSSLTVFKDPKRFNIERAQPYIGIIPKVEFSATSFLRLGSMELLQEPRETALSALWRR